MTEWKDEDEFTTTFGTLKQSMAEAQEAERERIIALLETEMCEAYGENCDDNPHCTARNRVIALIKGEKE